MENVWNSSLLFLFIHQCSSSRHFSYNSDLLKSKFTDLSLVGVSKSDSNILKPVSQIEQGFKKQENYSAENKYAYSEPEHEAHTKNSLANEITSVTGAKPAPESKWDLGWELELEHNLANLEQWDKKASHRHEEQESKGNPITSKILVGTNP